MSSDNIISKLLAVGAMRKQIAQRLCEKRGMRRDH